VSVRASRRAALCVAGIALASVAAPLRAQPSTPGALPPRGARVRVETASGSHVVGTVRSIEGDTIRLRVGRRYETALPLLALSVADVRGYSVSLGRDRPRGARNGALVGGGLGLGLVAFAAYTDAHASGDAMIPGTLYAVPAALLLTGVGALLGVAAAPEGWSAPVALQLAPGPDESLRVGLRLRL
jgi:hypothetical protein